MLNRMYTYIRHVLSAKNTKGHGVHSPFLFRFIEHVVYLEHPFYVFEKIEKRRTRLLKSRKTIFQKDFGMGESKQKNIADIARTSLKRRYWGQMLFRLIDFTQANIILELGTSLGITTSYLASARSSSRCMTLEGSPEIANIAQETFDAVGIDNVEMVVGNIDETLSDVLADLQSVDVVFIDANHCQKAVIEYFEQCLKYIHSKSVFIIDDIHWSKDMECAWYEICKSEQVTATFDLFEIGIVFFDEHFPKKTFKLKGREI